MKWPEKPTCHAVSPVFRLGETTWRAPEPTRPPYGQTFRTCSYCGSIHPEDLVRVVEAGAKLGGSDWKYGWPHKFYVDNIPNPLAGQTVEMGSRSQSVNGAVTTEPIMGPAPEHTMAKWYNDHLEDSGYDDEALKKLTETLSMHAGIAFEIRDGKLHYKAPFHGYQR